MTIIAFLAGLIIGSVVTLALILFRYRLRVKAHRVNTIHGEWRFSVPDAFNETFLPPPAYGCKVKSGHYPPSTCGDYNCNPDPLGYICPLFNPATGKIVALSVDSQEWLDEFTVKRYNDQV